MKPWWKEEPLRFECRKDCTECCRQPGFVHMDEDDIGTAAVHLETSPHRFRLDYLSRMGPNWIIEVTLKEPCPFLTETGCRIHKAKPKQCRAFPFWKENLESPKTWEKTREACPGIGEGPEVPPETIQRFKGWA